jgi:hypothetical protein
MDRFPLLPSDLGAREALQAIVEDGATGAIMRTHGGGHTLLAWRDVADAAARNHHTPLTEVHGLRIHKMAIAVTEPPSAFVGVEISSIPGYQDAISRFTIIGAKSCPNLPPPYACNCNGKCPY